MRSNRKIVILGMLTRIPVAGVVWQNLHYVLGFERLGFEVHYVEAHARTPSMLMTDASTDGSAEAAALLDRTFRAYDLGDRWAFHARHSDGRVYGKSERQLADLYRDAAVIINLHGGTVPEPEHHATDRLVYVETDPVQVQIDLAAGDQETIDYLAPHCAFFTFGENYALGTSQLPTSDRFEFRPTRQPVVMDLWRHRQPLGDTYTTVASWRQPWRPVSLDGQTYSWSKDQQFRRFLDVPSRSSQQFELALAAYGPDDEQQLRDHGWRVRDGYTMSLDPTAYQRFIQASRGEFTSAKEQNVHFRTGWFSDRSATYLSSGRPVVTQDTGFGDVLPTGEGLFSYRTEDEAVSAIEEIERDPEGHSRAASDLAREHFDAERVLTELLDHAGIDLPTGRRKTSARPFPHDLVLEPLERRPMRLQDRVVDSVLEQTLPTARHALSPLAASVVVVTHNNLVFTRLALESLLANTEPSIEVIVVDNASQDDTPDYLTSLAARNGAVRVVFNDSNAGFAAANNAGLQLSTAPVLVLLNNDTIVPSGWLWRLLGHLDDASVGAVGPVTNRIGNEAEIPTNYRTYGGLEAFANQRRRTAQGRTFDIDVLTMFCFAMRRDVYERVGPLDESFGVGTLEDDDYSRRIRETGLRTVCVEDEFIHHFSQASFGALIPTGEYARLQERNRALFERKWEGRWQGYSKRHDPEYDELRTRLRARVLQVVPEGAGVAVISKGDDELLEMPGLKTVHFPPDVHGGFVGFYPANDDEAAQAIDRVRDLGASYLVVPRSAAWWLEFYPAMAARLRSRAHVEGDACSVYALDDEAPLVNRATA